jgi:hypothetical protein
MSNKRIIEVAEATPTVAKVNAVHPFGSKLLVEVLTSKEMLGTNLFVGEEAKFEGAPQAFIAELGPQVSPESGLKVGQRIYWTGKGTQVVDPRATNNRVRALLEISNVLAIIE